MGDRERTLKPPSAGTMMVIVAAVFVLTSWAIATFQAVVDREAQITSGLRGISNLAGVLSEHTTERLRMVDQALYGLSTALYRSGSPTTDEAIYRILQNRRVATPGILQFFIVDHAGIVRYSSEALKPEAQDISWRPELETLKNGWEGRTVIIPTLVGQVGAAKDKLIMAMARRVDDADGRFAGAIYGTIALEDFSKLAGTIDLIGDMSVGMYHTDGTVIWRVPDMPGIAGSKLPDEPFSTALEKSPVSGITVTQLTDESSRIYGVPLGNRYRAYRRVSDTPTILYVSISETSLLMPWRNNLRFTITEQLILTLLVSVLAMWGRYILKKSRTAEEEHLRRLECLSAVTADLMACHDHDSLLRRAADVLREIVPSHLATINYMHPSRPSFAGPRAISLSDKYEKWRTYDAPLTGIGVYQVVMQHNVPIRLTQAELEAHPAWNNFGGEKDYHPPLRGWLAAPLISQEGKNIGFVQISDRLSGEFDAGDEAVVIQLARVLSIALENLRLLEETDKAAKDAKAAAIEAQEARDQIDKVFSATSDGVVVMDKDLRYIFANDAFCNMLGEPRETLIGKSFYERAPHRVDLAAKLEQCRDTKKRITFETTIVNRRGEKRWFEIRAYPMDDKISASIRDLTERYEAEQKLMAAQRMDAVGRLTGGLAHDFNNLLAVVMGNAEIILMTLKDQTLVRPAQLIKSAATRGASLVSRLLAFARSQPLDPAALDVAAVIRDVEILLSRSLPENIKLKVKLDEPAWLAVADLAQLENVLVNLVMNARDAMPNGGTITISASGVILNHAEAAEAEIAPNDYVLLQVTDTGIGMTPDIMAKAFEPFFTTKEIGKGTGLGLSMVYGFAKQSGGSVSLRSAPGEGTTVRLFLPRAHEGTACTPVATTLHYDPTGTESVLLVEDDDMVRDFVEVLLRGLGYKVIAHGTSSGALAAVAAGFKPDLLLCDVILADKMNGPEVAAEILKQCPSAGVLYMSGYAEKALTYQGRLPPNTQMISKPFRRHDLAVKIRAVIKGEVDNDTDESLAINTK